MTEAAHKSTRTLHVVPGGRSDLEQELVDIATGAATYYKTLITKGIPAALARKMLLEWHAGYMGRDDE